MTDTERHLDAQAANAAAPIDDAELNQVVGGVAAAVQSVAPDLASQDFSIVKHIDKASPKLYELCATGVH
jgi:type VI protein secretion system component Hcp